MWKSTSFKVLRFTNVCYLGYLTHFRRRIFSICSFNNLNLQQIDESICVKEDIFLICILLHFNPKCQYDHGFCTILFREKLLRWLHRIHFPFPYLLHFIFHFFLLLQTLLLVHAFILISIRSHHSIWLCSIIFQHPMTHKNLIGRDIAHTNPLVHPTRLWAGPSLVTRNQKDPLLLLGGPR